MAFVSIASVLQHPMFQSFLNHIRQNQTGGPANIQLPHPNIDPQAGGAVGQVGGFVPQMQGVNNFTGAPMGGMGGHIGGPNQQGNPWGDQQQQSIHPYFNSPLFRGVMQNGMPNFSNNSGQQGNIGFGGMPPRAFAS